MKIALTGLPFSGKSTLFHSLTAGKQADAAGAAEHLAMVKVADPRLNRLADMYKPKKKTNAAIEFLDVPGLDFSTDAGRADAQRHIATLRQTDALVVVLRAFEDPGVFAYRDRVDPEADWREINSDFLLTDLQTVTNRIDKLEAQLKKPSRTKEMARELELQKRCAEALENERPLSEIVHDPEEQKMLRSFALLTTKPVVVVRNLGEGQMDAPPPWPAQITQDAAATLDLAATLEAELAELDAEAEAEFCKELGIEEPAVNRLTRACFTACSQIVFFTYGEDECRAWPIAAGTHAVDAAGEIHSDLARGFIRAEVVHWSDFAELGDMKFAREAGKFRLEGKTYVVQDGDLITIRFNV
ncbi:MAG: Ribosome-binding ATPase YchF [Phycisphaerae bacterium]|nr:Ribosome-binding ATPase YchF [Phycisphaerae bacterium]